jgi:hypothetical protein
LRLATRAAIANPRPRAAGGKDVSPLSVNATPGESVMLDVGNVCRNVIRPASSRRSTNEIDPGINRIDSSLAKATRA